MQCRPKERAVTGDGAERAVSTTRCSLGLSLRALPCCLLQLLRLTASSRQRPIAVARKSLTPRTLNNPG